MKDDWKGETELLAGAAHCPMAGCGALAVAYRTADSDVQSASELWEFTCPHCGQGFAAPEDDLLFRPVPEEWLRAGIHSA